MFPIYVIGDETREPERIAYLKEFFTKHTIPVTFFQPTYKDTLTSKELERFTNQTHGRLFKASEKSVFLNFLYLFEKCALEHDGYVLILESDVIFEGDLVEYFYNLQEFIKKNSPDAVSIGSGCDMIDEEVNVDDMTIQISKKSIMRCTDTILFSVKGIRMILDYMSTFKVFDEPIDNFLQTFMNRSNFRFYWIWPSITIQGSQYGHYKSSIQTDTY